MIDYNDIFNKILESNTKKSEVYSKDFLKSDISGNTITGRFIPNINDPQHSVFNYFHHGWKSHSSGKGLFYLCLNTIHEKCPICQKSVNMWKSNDPIQKELSKEIRRRTNWLTNFYVINNPKKPEDNGTIKLLKFGKQILSKYETATSGDDSAFYGSRIWRLDEQGCSFRIKCEPNSTSKDSKDSWVTYINSSFLPAGPVSDDMTPEKIETILNSVFDLTKIYKTVTSDEMLADLDKHFAISDVVNIQDMNTNKTPTPSPTIVHTESAPKPTVQESIINDVKPTEPTTVNEQDLDQMLAELDGKN